MSLPLILLDDDIDFDSIEIEDEEEQQPEPGYTYRLNAETIQNNVDELEAVKQAVRKILLTPQFEYEIYSFDYGIDLESLIGRAPEEITVLLKRMMREALLHDDRITAVDNFEIGFSEDECLCKFTVSTIYGEYQESLEVNI